MLSSNYHVEMSPGDVGNNDRYVVQVRSREEGTGGLGQWGPWGREAGVGKGSGEGTKRHQQQVHSAGRACGGGIRVKRRGNEACGHEQCFCTARAQVLLLSSPLLRFCVPSQAIIKEMARSRPLDVAGNKGFKVLVLNEVDSLSREAQQSLRRTMEKYSAACRLVMCCSNVSRVMDPVRSRCMCIRVAAPAEEQVVGVLQGVAAKEGLALPHALAARIAGVAGRNLRKALLQLEVCRVAALPGPLGDDQAVQPADWELYIAEVANDMLSEQSPKRLYQVRGTGW